MAYLFNKWRWYIGEGEGENSTDIEPANKSTSSVPEELRSRWVPGSDGSPGYWVERPYNSPGYLFNKYGWYIGEGKGPRSTRIAPENFSTDNTPGELRSMWVERGWVETPYNTKGPDSELKAKAKDILEKEYTRRLSLATLGGMEVEKIFPSLVKADMVLSRGGDPFAIVSGGESQVINASKLNSVAAYYNECSNDAKTHWQAIQIIINGIKAETPTHTLADLKAYRSVLLSDNNWPNPVL